MKIVYTPSVVKAFSATVYTTARLVPSPLITIGNDSIVDDFCFLYGDLTIGNFVHIAIGASIVGRVVLEDFSSISGGVRVYAADEDTNGLTNPCVPAPFRVAKREPVTICKHAIIGANSVVLPGVTIGMGAIVGALSLVKTDLEPWGIYVGAPVRKIGERKRELVLESEARFMAWAYRDGVYVPKDKRGPVPEGV